MSKLVWDQVGEHYYETGTNKGVLYPIVKGAYTKGIAWSGLTAVTENPSGAEVTSLYADNIKYLSLISAEDYGITIEAYQSPEEFDACDGTASVVAGVSIRQQVRQKFGFSWQSKLGNDTLGEDYGYLIHIMYNGLASPSEKGYSTINDSPEAMTMSWEVSTTPVEVPGYKPTACITIDSTKVDATLLAELEAILYGDDTTEARLPLPEEIISLFT